jgi:hypothetical protein
MSSGTNRTLVDVWGSSPSDVFAVGYAMAGDGTGEYGIILHNDGSSWSAMSIGTSGIKQVIWGRHWKYLVK